MHAIMEPQKLKEIFLIVQGPDGHSEEIGFGFMGIFVVKRVMALLHRYGIRAQIEERVMECEKKY